MLKDCQEIRQYLEVYLDGEFDDEDRHEVEVHLTNCYACQSHANYERRFREAVRARIPKSQIPEELQERIVITTDKYFTSWTWPKRLAWGSVPAVAAVALVISFTWTVTSGFSPLVEAAVERHSIDQPVEVNSSDTDVVESWFKSKVRFHVTLPRSTPQQLLLVGARLSNLVDRQAALVRYRSGLHDFSLFVFVDPGGDIDGKSCQKIRSNNLCLSEKNGYTVAVWRSHGLAYSMVGESSPNEMLAVLDAIMDF
jgi:Predicted transmembrane transcriptional regulator (anti-sigma factor)